ncbi:cation acetate symporter [Streptomyces sp. NPDC002917]|uniref:sodium/solute symporter n=1 Tax=unclassified Streptomyces TaxID=2593676 RepID=UPI002E809271|nr:cation acetate symporter [Streptomyces sp. NBC_00562]WTD37306.1 cation acetate symporter [Streptomyces sp. NBC_01643]WUC23767.1 cation acetate symporter [Streptomyces sp. NBC_00562]
MSRTYAVVAVAAVVLTTLLVGGFGLRISRTTSDFYVASRTVRPRLNAAAISGEYLSAASFLGIAGLVLVHGPDMLWYPVGYTAGYLLLLVFVAAPLRRSGAYTLPDFAEGRLESRQVRRLVSVLVVGAGWLYLVPQLQGAGLTLKILTGAPGWLGDVLVASVVVTAVAAGGMRSITFVQVFQYWLKLTALLVPAIFLVLAWHGSGRPRATFDEQLSVFRADHPLYATYGLIIATFLGTMGLPHVVVRFYTSPNGRDARRTTVVVLALIGVFYLLPPVYGALGRVYAPELIHGGDADAAVLLLPERVIGGLGGDLLGALIAGGAFAAFLSTASGLTMAVAGVITQDVLPSRGVRHFRLATVLAMCVPLAGSLMVSRVPVADSVGMAFAVSASSFCPLLVLGIWWRRLTPPGAIAGLLLGGGSAFLSVAITVSGAVRPPGWPHTLLAWPAVWSVPVGFLAMVLVSLATPGRIPPGTNAAMTRFHLPEALMPGRHR